MLLLCLLSAIWFLTRQNNFLSTFNQFSHHKTPLETVAYDYPHRFVDGEFEQSFAGRTEMNVRAPFGPNPQQKNIIDQKFMSDHTLQKKYQLNLKQMHIDNNDWRLDPIMNGPFHFYQDPHQPIRRLDQIKDFSNNAVFSEISEFYNYDDNKVSEFF